MKIFLRSCVDRISDIVSNNYVHIFNEKNSLIAFCFHGLFKNDNEIKLNYADPQQKITIDIFRQFIEYYLKHDFIFISPLDILDGLSPEKKYILLTFDDGYRNNHLSLQILHEFRIPATFFISTNHIESNKCFWWDVIYRERLKRNSPIENYNNEVTTLKKRKNNEIEQYIINNFGKNAFTPISDIDRPFSPSELKAFSNDPFVFLGNHTANHAILTNYSPSEIKSEIGLAQIALLNLTGITPIIIAYPNGNFSDDVLTISKEIGLKLGITTIQKKNYLPINLEGINPYLLNRFFFWGDRDIKKQCDFYRSDINLGDLILKFIKSRASVKRESY
jgi:peptidoglycan/xylan/chitin deacetylase (PgdA/CDA1 family)